MMSKHAFMGNAENKCCNTHYTFGKFAQHVIKGNNNFVLTHSNVLYSTPLPKERSMPKLTTLLTSTRTQSVNPKISYAPS